MAVATEVRDGSGVAVRSLRWPAAVFLLGVLVHGSDHLHRGMMASPPSIMVAGTVQFVLVVLAVVLVWLGWARSPELAAAVAVVSVVGFGYAHLMPAWWPAYSDSFVTGTRVGVTWFSWVTVVAELGTAILLAIAAVRAVRSRRWATGSG